METVRLTDHARLQAKERGASEDEIRETIKCGLREPAQRGRILCRYNFPFNRKWGDRFYAVKQVAPIICEEANEIVVITVYTFYF